ncbi:MAG: dienelactone hydrolase family protein [Gammaproteobacteria bacterium]
MLSIPSKDGQFSGYYAPNKSGSAPGIILIQEIFGVNPSMRAIADRFADAGYSVLAPDLFFRVKPNIQLGYTGEDLEKAFEYYHSYDVKQGVADLDEAVKTLRQQPECNGKVAVLGFCLGGKLSYLTAAEHPVDACVAFYGGGIADHLNLSKQIHCPVLMHFGEDDDMISPEQVESIRAAFAGRSDVEIYVYPGVGHAFYNHARASYNLAAATLADERTLQFLRKHLK